MGSLNGTRNLSCQSGPPAGLTLAALPAAVPSRSRSAFLQVAHHLGRAPLEGLPHGGIGALFDVSSPDPFRPVDLPTGAAGQEAAIHGAADVQVVPLGPPLGPVLAGEVPLVLVARVAGLAVQRRTHRLGVEDLRQVPVVVVLAPVPDLLKGQPLVVGKTTEVGLAGQGGVAGDERPERGWAVLLDHRVRGFVELPLRHCHVHPVVVDRTVDADVGLVAAPDVLDVARVRLGPVVVLPPRGGAVAPGHLQEHHEPLLVQMVDLPVEIPEVLGVDPVQIRIDVFVPGNPAGKGEGATAFVVHVLGAPFLAWQALVDLPLMDPGRADPEVALLVQPDHPRLPVVRPVREGGDDPDQVEALLLAQAHGVLDPRLGSDRPLPVVLVPGEAERRRRPPGVADHDERRPVGVLATSV